jgi:hypothetical protein
MLHFKARACEIPLDGDRIAQEERGAVVCGRAGVSSLARGFFALMLLLGRGNDKFHLCLPVCNTHLQWNNKEMIPNQL